MTDRSANLKITVSTLTRKRPEMLAALVRSWGDLVIPSNCIVRFLVVENDKVANSKQIVQEAGSSLANGCAIEYVLEPELGIPFGRNRAAREAIANGSDLLCFVDDDEVVAQDWLERLVAGYRSSSAVLLGAPLRAAGPSGRETGVQRLMLRNISNRYLAKEQAAARRGALNDTGGVTVVTNNWLGETRLFSEVGLWFDETMRMTGGTDAKFYADAVGQGLTVGWVPDAFVYETIPPERLSFWYQAARGRDQSNTYMRRKLKNKPVSAVLGFLSIPIRFLGLVVAMILMPIQPDRRFIQIARTLGWLVGVIGIFFGYKSALYKKVSGH
ncbi:glycosyltransferase family 2 protein [Ruegeria arenilitoris]|uniref:glycosyltransferase family 2 protein n=1 Tax=Ruegeria arenilitoris TaxID=1173585 RepID=UPI0014808DA0|nr:glycosyltransferase [Ruegeria arenilitoris]